MHLWVCTSMFVHASQCMCVCCAVWAVFRIGIEWGHFANRWNGWKPVAIRMTIKWWYFSFCFARRYDCFTLSHIVPFTNSHCNTAIIITRKLIFAQLAIYSFNDKMVRLWLYVVLLVGRVVCVTCGFVCVQTRILLALIMSFNQLSTWWMAVTWNCSDY